MRHCWVSSLRLAWLLDHSIGAIMCNGRVTPTKASTLVPAICNRRSTDTGAPLCGPGQLHCTSEVAVGLLPSKSLRDLKPLMPAVLKSRTYITRALGRLSPKPFIDLWPCGNASCKCGNAGRNHCYYRYHVEHVGAALGRSVFLA